MLRNVELTLTIGQTWTSVMINFVKRLYSHEKEESVIKKLKILCLVSDGIESNLDSISKLCYSILIQSRVLWNLCLACFLFLPASRGWQYITISPLSWSDHFLITIELIGATNFHRESGLFTDLPQAINGAAQFSKDI